MIISKNNLCIVSLRYELKVLYIYDYSYKHKRINEYFITMSITRITYLNEFIPNEMFISNNPQIEIWNFWDKLEVKQFLNKLEIDQAYVVTFEFVTSFMIHDRDGPSILLGKPILITKNSNPEIVSNYLKERINLVIDSFYLDDEIIASDSNPDGPGLLLNYTKINIF